MNQSPALIEAAPLTPGPAVETSPHIAVYRYGLLPPTANAGLVTEQMRLAHQYRNKLVELERRRRSERDEIIAREPEIASIDNEIRTLTTELENERKTILTDRIASRSKAAGDLTRAKAIRTELRDLWQKRKPLLKVVLGKPHVAAALAEAAEAHKQRHKAERATCGVFWGTYLQIEQAADQASKSPTPPRFQPWLGNGALAMPIMAPKGHEANQALARILAGENTAVRLNLAPSAVPGRSGRPLPRLLLRIGSDRPGGRTPIFAEWPIILHRPLPDNCLVKMVKVVRRRIGAHERWSANFTVTITDERPTPSEAKPLAVNLRWSKIGPENQPTTIAADWADADSRGEIPVAHDVFKRLRKADDLRSIRDLNFQNARARLVADLKNLTTPAALQAKLEHLHAWKSQGKLAAVAIFWRANRFTGDEEVFARLEAWRRQDKHLWDWEANNRRKALARRKDDYRVFAAEAARTHKTLVIEKLNIARLAEAPKVEETDERSVNHQASSQRFATGPSELRSALLNAFRRKGGEIVEVKAGLDSSEMLAAFLATGGVPVPQKAGRSERTTRFLKKKGLAST